jgi:hypothetical protein
MTMTMNEEETNTHVIREFTRIFKNAHDVNGVGHLFGQELRAPFSRPDAGRV